MVPRSPLPRHTCSIDAVLGQRLVFALIVFKIVYLHVHLVSSTGLTYNYRLYTCYFIVHCFSAAPTSRTVAQQLTRYFTFDYVDNFI